MTHHAKVPVVQIWVAGEHPQIIHVSKDSSSTIPPLPSAEQTLISTWSRHLGACRPKSPSPSKEQSDAPHETAQDKGVTYSIIDPVLNYRARVSGVAFVTFWRLEAMDEWDNPNEEI